MHNINVLTYSDIVIMFSRVENPYLLSFMTLHPQLCSDTLNHFWPHTYENNQTILIRWRVCWKKCNRWLHIQVSPSNNTINLLVVLAGASDFALVTGKFSTFRWKLWVFHNVQKAVYLVTSPIPTCIKMRRSLKMPKLNFVRCIRGTHIHWEFNF